MIAKALNILTFYLARPMMEQVVVDKGVTIYASVFIPIMPIALLLEV